MVATFSVGLRENSRIKSKLIGLDYSFGTILLANIADMLTTLVWFNTEDGHKRINRPDSILSRLLNIEKQSDYLVFNSIEEFEKARYKGVDK